MSIRVQKEKETGKIQIHLILFSEVPSKELHQFTNIKHDMIS